MTSLTKTQMQTSGPQVDGLLTGTDMLLPDEHVQSRLAHFDPEEFNLRDTSHLSRFLQAMLGEAGVGALRKTFLVNRLRNAMQSTHFLDLDRFYGALFGVRRRLSEVMPINPSTGTRIDPHREMTDAETWDEIHARDAAYRERIVKFARAIPLGATAPGLRQAAEALLGAPVQVYEQWELLDQLVQNPDGSYVAPGTTLFGIGRLGLGNRSEVILRPSREITPEEHSDMLRVLSRLKPAGAPLSIDPDGVALHTTMALRNVAADSEYWEVRRSTTRRTDGGTADLHVFISEPPLSRHQGLTVSYVDSVLSMSSYSTENDILAVEVSHTEQALPDGSIRAFTPDQALLPVVDSEGGAESVEGISTHPYAESEPTLALSEAP